MRHGFAIQLALASCLAGTAEAHRFQVERSLLFEAWDDGNLHVAAHIKVPRGQATRVLSLVARTDKEMERVLVGRALDGLKLYVGTATVTLSGVVTHLAHERNRPIELMLLGHVPIGMKPVELAVTTGPDGDPLQVRILEGERSLSPPARGTTFTLGRQDRASWRYGALAEPPAP